MEAREFRIGNFLQDREGRLCRIEEINKDEFKAPAICGGITVLPNKPIMLTEEWLLKFGFEKERDWKFSFKNNSGLSIWSNRNEQFNSSDKNYFSFAVSTRGESQRLFGQLFSYVHQLQNFYFSLTQTELTIK